MFGRITASYFYCGLLFFALAASPLLAQERRQYGASAVTASASTEQVRFTAPADVYHLRLEVFDASGQKLFDSDFKFGNLLDWNLLDQQGGHLPDGAYRCLLTTKTLAGQRSQKHGLLVLQAGQPSLQSPGTDAQASQPANPLSVINGEDFLTILGERKDWPLTLLAHDGERGQVASGRGGLSFRTGDFFAGKDQEQMRLTPDGRLGLGVSDPQAKLDVAGLIRTGEGLVFPDGTVQTTAYVASGRSLGERSGLQRDVTERGFTELTGLAQKNNEGGFGQPVKTNIPDDLTVSGNLIFTPPSPQYTRDITMQNNNGGLRFFGAPTLTSSPAAAAIQFWGNNSPFPGQLYLDAGAHNSGALIIRTAPTGGTIAERVRVTANGGVGIGVSSPIARLHVVGTSDEGLRAISSSNAAIYAASTSGIGTYSQSSSNIALYALSNSNTGVQGQSTDGIGVVGNSSNSHGIKGTTGTAGSYAGVYGTNTAATGTGVLGEANNVGVWGKSGVGTGVYGASTSGSGVFGLSTNSIGVMAQGLGQARNAAALRADNANSNGGMAAYLTNASNFATAHLANASSGEVLYLQGNGGPFIKAVNNNETATLFVLSGAGNVGIGVSNPTAKLEVAGLSRTQVLQITGGADLSEQFEVTEVPAADSEAAPEVRPGVVVSIDADRPGSLVVSNRAYDHRVAGIISGAGGIKPGMLMSQSGSVADGSQPVALTGRVYCWADASNGPIEPGDMLTTAHTPGHAMKATDHNKAQGAIIGKAMTSLKQGKGLVLVLVTLQ